MSNGKPNKEEEIYCLTPYGLLCQYHEEKTAKQICDQIELYLRRSGEGIVIDDNQLQFVKLRKSED
jgi:hypothetical protein